MIYTDRNILTQQILIVLITNNFLLTYTSD